MKKIFTLVLVLLLAGITNSALAVDKAATKINKIAISASTNADDNITVTKDGSSFSVGITASKMVLSANPIVTNVVLSLVFTTNEEDFENKGTYTLEAPNGSTNGIIVATSVKGSKGSAVATTTGSMTTGTLKVISYDPTTRRLKGTISAKLSPATLTVIKDGTSKESEASKPVPITIKLDVILND